MTNMEIYEKSKACPGNALRTIPAGKLKGKSDINPVWRIKQLTELFGPCGIGWKLVDIKYWTEPGAAGEVSAWCSLGLMIKVDGQWSDPIEGVGGSMLIDFEKGKLTTNDEAYKMAQTDAISVACKLLGFAADVYWEADRTKYSNPLDPAHIICERCSKAIQSKKNKGILYTPEDIAQKAKEAYGQELCWTCMGDVKQERAGDPSATGF